MRSKHEIEYLDEVAVFDEMTVKPSGMSLIDPEVCSAILCNYSKLKAESEARFNSDLYYLLCSFDEIAEVALTSLPMYEKILLYKIDGMQNAEVA